MALNATWHVNIQRWGVYICSVIELLFTHIPMTPATFPSSCFVAGRDAGPRRHRPLRARPVVVGAPRPTGRLLGLGHPAEQHVLLGRVL